MNTLDAHVHLISSWSWGTRHRSVGGPIWYTKLPDISTDEEDCSCAYQHPYQRAPAFNQEMVIQSGVLQVPFLVCSDLHRLWDHDPHCHVMYDSIVPKYQ